MVREKFPDNLQDKIFEICYGSDDVVLNIISYFPFTESEKQEIISILSNSNFDGFRSIFSDTVSDEEWIRTKDQIRKKFKDELFDIDKI